MEHFPDLQSFWSAYFDATGGQAWTIVYMAQDGPGLLLCLADPLQEQSADVLITQVKPQEIAAFTRHYKRQFMAGLGLRFGSFRPDVDQVLTEYPDWPTFYEAWLNDNANLIQGNLPLLFDYPSADEYRILRLKGADAAGYRRLMIVLYQYRKRRFQRIFIKGIDDRQYVRIQHQIIDMYRDALSELLYRPTTKVAT